MTIAERQPLTGRPCDDAFIDRRGISVDISRSMYCTCYDTRSMQPNFNCQYCGGLGRLYEAPATEKALITNVRQDKAYSIVGVWELGTCRCTVKSHVHLNAMDRVVFKNMMLGFSELIRRGERTIGAPADKTDLLRFHTVELIEKVKTNTTTYVKGTDFELFRNNTLSGIKWIGATPPTAGAQISILYQHRPEFIVWDVPQIRSDSDNYQLPKFVVLRRKDMANEKASNV